ncbi:SusC/RagA family TonB-linked outer membrane protein [Chryseobacterium sp. JV274]|jgi:TonB-linked SusC/RagA family outer membrane protein|uniref:SusC/RagA family TonB-linked outer membrane protein n=1 Tax=unclassified Chryseobacterium TaxID=2593645 RepID=UPI0015C1D695|nr:SusC/RagA family TonB-linked outer membrane protein [Chryseobacterium sp. JV274]CAD0221250.1 SusC/RagA family TonB-linked outer membrane protein [Chryseobacterium sp. JV274]
MKKLTASLLVLVLSSSIAVANAQQKNDTIKTKEIEGVVVTALGIKREKKSLGYASEEVKAAELTGGTTNTGNVASLLSGKVAGLQVNTNNNFGGSANLLIRGYKSLSGGSPLIVIDGSPVNNNTVTGSTFDYGNFLSDINQEDIESVNVLKGAAASALYGERGSDGVILIVTKSGRGNNDGSWGVTLNSGITAGFIDKSTFPTYQTKYGAGYGGQAWNEDPGPGGYNYANFVDDASYGPAFNPNQLVYQWDSFDPSSPNYGKATPWVAAKNGPIKFFETPVTYINTITIEKGNKTSNLSLSYSNMLSNGLMPNSELRKNTISAKFNHDFTDKLHASVFTTLTLQDTRGRNETGYSDNIVSGFRQWWQTNVDVLALRDAYANNGNSNFSWNRSSAADGTPQYWNNPYFQRYQNYQSDDRTRIFSYAQLKYDVSKNFGITGKLSYDDLQMVVEERLMNGSLPQAFGASGLNVSSGYARTNVKNTEINFDLFANYKFDITSDLSVSGIAGGNVRRNLVDNIFMSTEGGLSKPGLFAISNSIRTILPPDENYAKWVTSSLYATASFGYKNFLFVDGTYRVDQSSNLPKGNNSYGYPSVTGAVILSEFVKQPWLSFWKLRANYAEVGSSTNNFRLVNTFKARGEGLFDQPYFLANPNLKPQRSKETEFGMEAQFFKNRLGFDVAIYKTRTFDQIINLPVSSATGYRTFLVNAGQIDNKGVEVQLNGTPFKTDNFTWDVNVNWSKNENKVIALNGDSQNYLMASYQGGVSLNARVGESFGALVGSDYVYNANGDRVIDPATGRYLRNNNQVIGNITPDWVGGIRNSFRYKDFTVSFLIDVKKGGDVFSTDMYYGLATGLYAETADYREGGFVHPGVNPNGNVNTTPAINPGSFGNVDGYRRMPNKRFVYDASYVKLREASIGYSLPKSILANTSIRDAKISIVGRNLWIIHKNLPYADPEAGTGNGLGAKGNSIGVLPTTRDIGIDLTLKF